MGPWIVPTNKHFSRQIEYSLFLLCQISLAFFSDQVPSFSNPPRFRNLVPSLGINLSSEILSSSPEPFESHILLFHAPPKDPYKSMDREGVESSSHFHFHFHKDLDRLPLPPPLLGLIAPRRVRWLSHTQEYTCTNTHTYIYISTGWRRKWV